MSAKTQPFGHARSGDLVRNCGNPATAKAENRNGRLREPVAPGASAQLLGQFVRKQSAGHCGSEVQHKRNPTTPARHVGLNISTRIFVVDQFLYGPVIGLLGVPVCQQLEVSRFEIL